MNKAIEQLQGAEMLGGKAFNNAIICAPAMDKDLLDMLEGRKIGETPAGEASSISIMEAWTKGWFAERDKNIKKRK